MPKFELVLPCYNEAASLEKLLRRTIRAAEDAGLSATEARVIFVENGSRDDSRAVLARLAADPALGVWFHAVLVDQNRGYGHGLATGLAATTAPVVGWSHADEQCDPADAFRAYRLVTEAEAPTLVRGIRRGRGVKDRLVSRVFELIASAYLGHWFYEINAQPKVFPRTLIDGDFDPPLDFAFDLYVLDRAHRRNYRQRIIPVDFPPRAHGLSNWAAGLRNRSTHIRNMIRYIRALRRRRDR